jgi:hypothetical protein
MVVRFQLSALKQTKWYEVFLRIVFGGLATVATGMVAKAYGPVVGGLFLAFPAIFPASATLIEKHENEKKQRAGMNGVSRARKAVALDARGATIGSIALAVFLWKFLFGRPAWLILPAATLTWLGTSIAIWQLRRLMRGHLMSK